MSLKSFKIDDIGTSVLKLLTSTAKDGMTPMRLLLFLLFLLFPIETLPLRYASWALIASSEVRKPTDALWFESLVILKIGWFLAWK